MDTRPRYTLSGDNLDLDEVIRGFITIDNDVTKLQRINRQPFPPSEPHVPKAAPHWETLGAFMGMCPHEVGIIMEHALGHPSETTKDALRHLMVVAKLQAGEKIGEHRAKVATRRATYEQQLAKYHQDEAAASGIKHKLDALIAERDRVFRASWSVLVDDFYSRCVVADHRLARMDGGLLRVIRILVTSSKHVNINEQDPNDHLLEVKWELVYQFKGPHISTILREFKSQNVFAK
jgi:hypothetical protein